MTFTFVLRRFAAAGYYILCPPSLLRQNGLLCHRSCGGHHTCCSYVHSSFSAVITLLLVIVITAPIEKAEPNSPALREAQWLQGGASPFLVPKAVGTEVLNILQKLTMSTPYRPVVMSGPSGSGKSTLLRRLMDEYKDCFAFSVSHTTRKPRPGEVHGKDYLFVEKCEMERSIANNEFIESAEFSGNLYGTSKKAVDDVAKTGRICILDIDMQGVKNIKSTNLNPRYIFIKAPSMEILEKRLRGRNTDTEEAICRRLTTAKAELEYSIEKGVYDLIIENNDVEVAYEQLKGFLSTDTDSIRKSKYKAR